MRIVLALVAVALLSAGYFWLVLTWSYSSGERAGWIQKLSKKGWVCKTWEGELAMKTISPCSAPGCSAANRQAQRLEGQRRWSSITSAKAGTYFKEVGAAEPIPG
jgi:hypothetical protein